MAALGRSKFSLYRSTLCTRLCNRHACKNEIHFTNKLHHRHLQYLTKLVNQSSIFCNRQVGNRLQKLCPRFYSSNGNDKSQSPGSINAHQGNEKDVKDNLEASVKNLTEAKDNEPPELNTGEASLENVTQTNDNKPVESNTQVLEQQSKYVKTLNVKDKLKNNEQIKLNSMDKEEQVDFSSESVKIVDDDKKTELRNQESDERLTATGSVGESLGKSQEQELSDLHSKEKKDVLAENVLKPETGEEMELSDAQSTENLEKNDVSAETVLKPETGEEMELSDEQSTEVLEKNDVSAETVLKPETGEDMGLSKGQSTEVLEKDDVLAETVLKPETTKEMGLSKEQSTEVLEKSDLAETVLKPETGEDMGLSKEQSTEVLEESREAVYENKETKFSNKDVFDTLVTTLSDNKAITLKEDDSVSDSSMKPKVMESEPLAKLEDYIESEVKVEFEDEPDLLYKKIDLLIKSIDKEVLNSYLMFLQMAALGLEVNFQTKPRPKVWIQRYSVRKSVHIYKKHYRQYERRTYIQPCTIHKVTGSTASVFLEYIQRNLPEGVAMEVKKHQIDVFPDHLKPVIREAESSEA